MQVLDVGCGVGGPMGTLARQYGASFVGINNNAYQIERAKVHTRDVQSLCRFIHGDFMQIPEDDDHYDAAMAIEATPHAPDKNAAFREIFRVLRPGACFAGYEWCLTEDFDPRNAEHLRIKKDIEMGNGLPDIALTSEVCDALRMAGFELLEAHDLAPESHPETPWYRTLQGRYLSLTSIPRATYWPRLDQCGVTDWGEVAGGSRGYRHGQYAVEQGGGRAGRRRQVRCVYSDVFLPGP